MYQPQKMQGIATATEERSVNSSFRGGHPNELGSNNLSSDNDEESGGPSWYWNNSSNDEMSDFDEGENIGVDNPESDSELELLSTPKTTQSSSYVS